MDPIYLEQYYRMNRIFRHLKTTNEGRIHIQDSANYQDEMYAFFTACYHLKDWIINDPSKRITADVEEFINSHDSLQIAGDVCNGFKHLSLDRPRFGSGAKVAGSVIGIVMNEPYPQIKIKFSITANGQNYDAFDIASECLKLWTNFLKTHDTEFKSKYEAEDEQGQS